jgi:hypothetical protein
MNNSAPNEAVEVTVQLNLPLMPIDRSDYEDALHDLLMSAGIGEVVGGGSALKASGEIAYVDIHAKLVDSVRGVPAMIAILEAFGAPKGSLLRVARQNGDEEIPFGKTEGVAIYLDGVGLPKEVYATSDVNYVIEQLNSRLDGLGEMRCSWEGPTQTALYFYGPDAESMKERMSDFLVSYPLCAGARIVTTTPVAG